jgi:hypothetical protein
MILKFCSIFLRKIFEFFLKFLFRSRKLLEYNFYIRHYNTVFSSLDDLYVFFTFLVFFIRRRFCPLTTPVITSSSGFLWRSARCSPDWLDHSLEKSRRNRNPSAIVASACIPISRIRPYRQYIYLLSIRQFSFDLLRNQT